MYAEWLYISMLYHIITWNLTIFIVKDNVSTKIYFDWETF